MVDILSGYKIGTDDTLVCCLRSDYARHKEKLSYSHDG